MHIETTCNPVVKLQKRNFVEDQGDFDEAFSIYSFLQEQIFIRIVKKYSSLSEKTIIGAL
jgi:hypothetical protein